MSVLIVSWARILVCCSFLFGLDELSKKGGKFSNVNIFTFKAKYEKHNTFTNNILNKMNGLMTCVIVNEI